MYLRHPSFSLPYPTESCLFTAYPIRFQELYEFKMNISKRKYSTYANEQFEIIHVETLEFSEKLATKVDCLEQQVDKTSNTGSKGFIAGEPALISYH